MRRDRPDWRRSAPSRPSTSCTCTSSERHQIVHAWEARPGSGERGPDGRQAGEFTLDEALVDSFRFNLSRQIVGEVRGKEIWAMIKAMESGTGSISTTHAADAVAAVRKLVTCAMEAGPHVTHGLATSKLAATDRPGRPARAWRPPPRRRRLAAHAAGRRDHRAGTRASGRPATRPRTCSAPTPDGIAVPAVLPDEYRALAAVRLRPGGVPRRQPLGARP